MGSHVTGPKPEFWQERLEKNEIGWTGVNQALNYWIDWAVEH